MQPFGLLPNTVILMLGTRALRCGSHFSNGSCSLALALKGGRMAWTRGAGQPAGAQDGELSLHPIVGLFCRLEPSSDWNVLFWKRLLLRSFIPMAAGVREGCSLRSWQWESSTLLRYHPCEIDNVSKRKRVSVLQDPLCCPPPSVLQVCPLAELHDSFPPPHCGSSHCHHCSNNSMSASYLGHLKKASLYRQTERLKPCSSGLQELHPSFFWEEFAEHAKLWLG